MSSQNSQSSPSPDTTCTVYITRLKNLASTISENYYAESLINTDTLFVLKSVCRFINNYENTENESLKCFMPAMLDLIEKVFSEIDIILTVSTNLREGDFCKVQKLLKGSLDLLEIVREVLNRVLSFGKIHLEQFECLPKNLAEILFKSYEHCKKSEQKYGETFLKMGTLLNALFKKNNEIQSLFFILLTDRLIFDFSHDSTLVLLGNVIQIVGETGEFVVGLDMKTTAEHWKGYAKLTQQYGEELKRLLDVQSPVRFLSANISKNLIDIMDILPGDDKLLMRCLKMGNFMLKIVIKLCETYLLQDVQSELCDLILCLHRYSSPYLRSKNMPANTISSIESYFTVGAEPLLGILIDDREFFEAFNKKIKTIPDDEEIRLGFLLFAIAVLKKVSHSSPEIKNLWFDTDRNIIVSVLKISTFCHKELSEDVNVHVPDLPGMARRNMGLYEALLTHLSVASLTLTQENFMAVEAELLRSVFQHDFWRALLAIDLWCILGRYGSSGLCYNQLLYLLGLYKPISADLNRPERSYVGSLISRLFGLLSEQHKTRVVELFKLTENLDLWAVIGLKNIPSVLKTREIANTVKIVSECAAKFSKEGNCDIMNFVHLCNALQIISTEPFTELNNGLIDSLMSLWKYVIVTPSTEKYMSVSEINISQTNWFNYYVISLCNATTSTVSFISNSQLREILNNLKNLQNHIASNVKIPTVRLLRSLALKQIDSSVDQNQVFAAIADLFHRLLKDGNPIVKQVTFETFKHFAQVTKHERIILMSIGDDPDLKLEFANYLQAIEVNSCTLDHDGYLKLQNSVKFTHRCESKCIDRTDREPKMKKARFDYGRLIDKLKADVSAIVECSQMNELSSFDKSEIGTVIADLNKLM